MDETSTAIYNDKKEKLKQGDDVVVKQIGKGKDIMSVLREYKKLIENIFGMTFSRTVRANMSASEMDRLPDNELLGQMK